MTDDPFDTEGIRERVLAGWRAAAVRFREDANAEEDLALGGYRDRLVVELAQNAADAAARAGVAGRLLLRVTELAGGPVLVAANTGASIDADGVEALSTLRASAKRGEGSVGRFGVGFAAVLGVCDAPVVVSRRGGVRFSAADTRDLVAEVAARAPALAEEVARRDGHVPVLRLPFPATGTPPDGYDTAVVLPLRDAVAEDLVLRLLDDVGDPLLLALPNLAEVTVEVPGRPARTVRDVAERWCVVRREGRFAADLLDDRPTEERSRTAWALTWALPTTPDAVLPGVLHAPTPSDEPLPWPALLVATFPLDPSRRHVAAGPATDALVGAAAAAYADLLAARAASGATPWQLVPVGLPAGVLDGALRAAVLEVLPRTAFVIAAEDPDLLLRPRDAVALDPPAGGDEDVVAALAASVAGLVLAPRSAAAALDRVGVRRIALADVVEQLPGTGGPEHWRRMYDRLTPIAADPSAREALAALPVPLADGRVVRGARGTLLPGGPPAVAAALATLGARAVHPDAAHPLLERLGAAAAGPRAALDLPVVRAAVAAAADADGSGDQGFDTDRFDARAFDAQGSDADASDADGGLVDQRGPGERARDAVLTLVAAAVADGGLAPGELPWLGDLLLPDDDGEPAPAAELVLPGSAASRLLDPAAVGVVDADLVEAWGPAVLAAVGVLDGLRLVRAAGVPLDPDAVDDGDDGPDDGRLEAILDRLDGWAAWTDAARAAAPALADVHDVRVAELVAVPDLDAVDNGCWPEVLALLAADPGLHAAVTEPATLVGPRASAQAPSWTAWWLRRELGAGLPWADPDAGPEVVALLPAAPDVLRDVAPALRTALGAVRDLAGLDAAVLGTVLGRLAEPDLDLDAGTALRLWDVLARLAPDAPDVEPTDDVRVLDGAGTRLVPAEDAAVVGAPMYLQPGVLEGRGIDGAVVVAAGREAREALADLLDVPLVEDVAPGRVVEDGDDAGQPADVAAAVLSLLPGAPATWCEHDRLVVDGVEVDWWVDGADSAVRVHACTLDGLARGLAWAAGAWPRRAPVGALLEGEALGPLLADGTFDRS